MLDQEEIAALREGRFTLECDQIVLTQRTSDNPQILRGPGRFYQDTDGSLRFHVYARGVDYNPGGTREVGDLVPAEEYYRLEAVDFRGRHWTAEQVDPVEDHNVALRLSIARGRVSPLTGYQEHVGTRRPQRHLLRGHIFAGLTIPANIRSVTERRRGRWESKAGTWDVAEFRVDEVDIHLHFDADEFVATAEADRPLSPAYASRMAETLRFVLADDVWWNVLLETNPEGKRGTIFGPRRPRLQASLPPPVQPGYVQSFDAVTELFRCYLRFVLRSEDPVFLHPLSAEWGEVLRASTGTLQTQATIFCIAVETLTRMVFQERPVELQRDRDALALVRRWTRRIRKFLIWEGCPEPLRVRFEGMFSVMLGLSFRDRFAWLTDRGAVDGSLAERWDRLRPISAHGLREGQGDVDPLYRECMAVVGLLYQLVAYLIEYRGYLTSFAEPGWPLRPYPFAPAPVLGSDARASSEGQ